MSGIEGLLAGRVLGGRYRIEQVIGRGGMGVVYRALDERLGRRVAVKVITLAGSDPEQLERLRARFHREARAAAALPHHPNVVPVYDYGSDPELGLDYIVMELLRGSDLATRLARSGPPPLATALKVLYEAALGLAVGHRAGLIHRDVKPGNIFLAESDHQEIQVRVVDFGIAKLTDDEDSQLTQDGRVPHSPAFASPEQLRGLERLAPASDVFSLGAVGYQLLTGQRPFSDADRNRMSLGMPATPRPPRELNPAIPAPVEEIVLRALAFDAADRFPNAAAMATELGGALRTLPEMPIEPYPATPVAVLAGDDDHTQLAPPLGMPPHDEDDHTVLAPPAARPPRREPPARALPPRPLPPPEPRRRWGRFILWTLLLLALAGAAVALLSESGGEPRLVEEIPIAPDTLPVISPDVSVEEEGPAPTELDAYINNREGIRYFQGGQMDSALIQFQRAVEISPENAEYRRNLALTLVRLSAHDQAVDQLRQAIRLDPGQPRAYVNLGDALLARGETGDTVAAMDAYRQFLQLGTDARELGIVERRLRSLEATQAVAPDTMRIVPPAPDTSAARRDTAAVSR